jgi:hypothetical protein
MRDIESVLVDDGLSPIDDGLSPIDDGLSPIDDGLSPIDDGLSREADTKRLTDADNWVRCRCPPPDYFT